ncbi:MAG TPA: hypothetical protein HPP97_05685 [Desulfuromonadales bacterium]|nr:hypothetical protein [Desulfuromonadales bacterium]
MNKAFQRFVTLIMLVSLLLVIAACGGGSGGGGPSGPVQMITISGTATKGPIKNALVQIFRLRADGSTGALLGSGVSSATGTYAIDIPAANAYVPLLIRVTGQPGAAYISEAAKAEVPFTSGETFNAIVEFVVPGQSVAVTPLTEAAYQQFQKILTDNPALANDAYLGAAINAANSRIASLYFGLGSSGSMILANPAENISYTAVLLLIDQALETQKSKGFPANTTTIMAIVNQAFANAVLTNPAYQVYLQMLTAAAGQVKLANPNNPALIAAIDAIVALAGNPPAVPIWTDTVQPTAPTHLNATSKLFADNTGSVTLSWGAATDNVAVTGYDIYRDGIKIVTVSATTLFYTDLPLATNATYKYVVFAFDAVGNRSVASNQVQVPLGVPIVDSTPPTAPEGLSATTFIINDTTAQVTLSWRPSTDNKGVAGYDVFRDGVKIAAVPYPGYTDPSVAIPGTYQYVIVAFDGAGNRAGSNPLSVTPNKPSLGVTVNGQLSWDVSGLPAKDITAPSAPANLAATTFAQTATLSSVVLTWNAATDNVAIAGYEIYRDGVRIADKVTGLTYTNLSVPANITYLYYVIAVDTSGNRSIASNQLSVTPNQASLGVTINGQLSSGIIGLPLKDITPPTAPSNLTASTSAVTATTSAVLLSWSPSSDNIAVTGYEVYRNGSLIATVSLLGYTDASVTSNVTYTYYIKALDAAGNRSVASNTLSVTPNLPSLGVTVNGQISTDITGQPFLDITAPSAATNLTASTAAVTATTSSVLLSWSPATDNVAVTGYDVYRNGSKIATVTVLGYLDASVTSSATYTYYVIAFDKAGNRSPASSPLTVTPSTPSLGVTVSGQLSPGVTDLAFKDITAPTAPTNLTATTSVDTATTSVVFLAWSPSSDNVAVTGYDVYRNGVKVATVTTLVYRDSSVPTGVATTYFVKAFDAAGNTSPASSPLVVTPGQASLGVTINGQLSTGVTGLPQQDATAPSTPTNVTATVTTVTGTTSSINLAWNPSTDNTAVTGYEVYRNGTRITTVTTLVYNDSPVTSGVTYTYYVKAIDAAGNRSPASSQLTVTPSLSTLGITFGGQLSLPILGF